jgi:hypothetical protein
MEHPSVTAPGSTMSRSPEDILALKVGASTVGENLQRAIDAGVLLQNQDGTLELRHSAQIGLWLNRGDMPNCVFLNRFTFQLAYAQAAVPKGCEACYKVKVLPRTLRELVALYELAGQVECPSKCGIDLYTRHSQNIYAGYFYLKSLEEARGVFRVIRELVNDDPKLGSGVPIVIKRGCSNYEVSCGPSAQYTFRPELQDIEAYLKSRFRRTRTERLTVAGTIYGTWVPLAYQMGDDTYLDFTNGEPLYPKSLTYDPDGR